MNYLDGILSWDTAPREVKKSAAITSLELNELIGTVVNNSNPGKDDKWLTKELGKDKLRDIAILIELTARIGAEEKEENYEEFQSLVVDLLSAVYYAQQNRKNLHFSKYKALFKLISDEVTADTNRVPGQVWYRNNQLWLRTS